jgi:hypothetical protein
MRHLLALTLIALALPALADEATLGAGVTLTESTSAAQILADPDAWVGKKVRVEGKVLDVCSMAGCWMEIEESATHARLRVKVDDGVIVFPASAKGKPAAAEGTVELIPMDKEQYSRWLAHLAEEQGKTFDPTSVGPGPYRIVQLRGTGARIGP